jgi:hypothetical protein
MISDSEQLSNDIRRLWSHSVDVIDLVRELERSALECDDPEAWVAARMRHIAGKLDQAAQELRCAAGTIDPSEDSKLPD